MREPEPRRASAGVGPKCLDRHCCASYLKTTQGTFAYERALCNSARDGLPLNRSESAMTVDVASNERVREILMKAIKRYGTVAASAARTPRFTPDYHDEVSEEYLEKLRSQIDGIKTEGFRLTPISEPGW